MSDSIRKLADSRYASRLLEAHPELARELTLPGPFTRGEMAAALEGAGADDEAALMRRLRRLRSRVLLRVMARDLCGLADLSIAAALQEKELIVVAMGKLGGRELNVSSDIDLVFVHAGGLDDQARWEGAGRRLIRMLGGVTE